MACIQESHKPRVYRRTLSETEEAEILAAFGFVQPIYRKIATQKLEVPPPNP
jgi:hypothetical protein